MAEARCPASCGELIQGWIAGSEKLISCPINWFSTIEVTSGDARSSRERPLMRSALKLALQSLNIPVTESQGLKISFDSTIPVAKGMASSTADIAATITATYRHFQSELSEQQLASLCARLEPSDSTVFRSLTLFDHKQGIVSAQYGQAGNLDILILESPQQLSTAAYHRIDRRFHLVRSSEKLAEAAHYLAQSIHLKQAGRIGLATTVSAIESQQILPKPHFNDLLRLVEKHDLYGLNVAHSGTVVGLLYHSARQDIEAVLHDVRNSPIAHAYTQYHQCQLISGGVR
ncbi:GHMP family kinase ATP-binding protein [Vibrio mangrovi]|uniref:GHMP kinase n=1 Tax=Vibrio mangrovi TaxID=474394 RepID=A0A1Y6IY87_9VIBR|nr:GHMP kinase [Vibrio mangrovi]MDW6005166.1 GHMP kinase [Vibrio mangrovi]SMS02624.1 L-threonine kinase [Vibrio mangrovi]